MNEDYDIHDIRVIIIVASKKLVQVCACDFG